MRNKKNILIGEKTQRMGVMQAKIGAKLRPTKLHSTALIYSVCRVSTSNEIHENNEKIDYFEQR